MSMQTLVAWLAVLALICWALGAYNRLVRLRAAVVSALAAVEQAMRDEVGWALAQSPELPAATPGEAAADGTPDPLPVQPPLFDELHDLQDQAWRSGQAAARQLDAALVHARSHPLDADAMAMLSTAYQVFEQALDRLDVNPASALADDTSNATMGIPDDVMGRAQLELKLGSAIQDFNAEVTRHNLAITRLPALVLARFLGFRPAGPLAGLRHTP
ncbi:hypothetical protein CCO03_19170 [Comamonas serinivorans]|uniref:LemA family protein n=1 Tax=Comamonas serinivorans TaxID=1082851 RepID=A0A1Y0ESK6_9BURK|nr:hypothetical protein [Comamonas serinivorans]ARU06498.1 hypothetical protein CCO03_19170 [Comamonas serinivorans]